MRIRGGAFLGLLVLCAPAAGGEQQRAAAPAGEARVVVRAATTDAAEAAVKAAGGTVTHRLQIIDAVGATMDRRQLDLLRRSPADVRVFEDRALALAGDVGKPTAAPRLVGADLLHAANVTGRGVGIAFIDTGVSLSDGTATDTGDAPRIVAGYDAIHDATGLAAVEDQNGHGTHVLSAAASSNYTIDPTGVKRYNGVAPDARLVVVKAFDDTGWGTYAGVIRGIQWVVEHKAEYGIGVLNLSFGALPRSRYWEDPVNQAVMRAWQAGIVVVASAGNTGPGAQTIRVPGNVPYVITVGAMTDSYTPGDPSDDSLASFSAAGPTWERFLKPEVVAPGGHILGLMDKTDVLPREHREYVDMENSKYFTMSGTSQAAAMVSGSVALLLQAHPELTPDDAKCRMLSTAHGAVDGSGNRAYSVFQQGAGLVSAAEAAASTATGCANVGLNVGADVTGEQHFAGRARQQADGTFTVDGLTADGSAWNGVFQTGGGVFVQGDPWTDIELGFAGDPWTDTFGWPAGYPWNQPYLWSPALTETIAVNVWVQQQ